jgi:cytoskeletal protein RodZ
MNRNQKIALGCGGAGCLGLIVVTIVGCVVYFFYYAQARRYSAADSNYNVNVNTNSNSNSNDNSGVNTNSNSSNSNSSSTSDDSISDDNKHKLYQAATMTGDPELIRRVSVKIGLMDDDYTPGPNYQTFVAEHVSWAIRNRNFIISLDTPDKAREYVNQNFPN